MLSHNRNHDVHTIDRDVVAIDRHVMGSHRVRPNMRLGKRLYQLWFSAKEQTAITQSPGSSCPATSARAPLPAAAWASLVLGAALST